MSEKIDYDALAGRLSDPQQQVRSAGQVHVGGDAAAFGRAWAEHEYGSTEAVDAAMGVSRGRPRVGDKGGTSPTVRGRISDDDYAAFKQLERITGRSQSQLVREAVHQLLTSHHLIS